MKNLALFLYCLAALLLAGCIAASEEPIEASPGRNQTTKTPDGGWDDFPNKYMPTLEDLDSKVGRLPVPVGTRYTSLSTNGRAGLKVAYSTPPCTGDSTVFQYRSPVRDFFLYDTITFFDSAGIAHCQSPGGTRSREKHVRRVVELGVGEVQETIENSITDQDILPRHTIHGTGSIRLESGHEFTIQSYDVTLLTPFDAQEIFVLEAGMSLLYKDGYSIHLDLAKPHPYRTVDFFPADGPPDTSLIMTGPITHPAAQGGVDTVGYIDLFGDRTIRIRDWTGTPVAP
jgi:hypothetical protein